MEFTCQYTHDFAYNQMLLKQTRRRNMGSALFWIGLFALCAILGAYCWVATGFGWPVVLYGIIAAGALYPLLSPPFLVKRAWRKNCEKWGRDQFSVTVTIGESVHYLDDTGMEADIPWDKITDLVRSGPLFILQGEERVRDRRKKNRTKIRKTDYLFFPSSGFADGTGKELLDWMSQEHPKVSLA